MEGGGGFLKSEQKQTVEGGKGVEVKPICTFAL